MNDFGAATGPVIHNAGTSDVDLDIDDAATLAKVRDGLDGPVNANEVRGGPFARRDTDGWDRNPDMGWEDAPDSVRAAVQHLRAQGAGAIITLVNRGGELPDAFRE